MKKKRRREVYVDHVVSCFIFVLLLLLLLFYLSTCWKKKSLRNILRLKLLYCENVYARSSYLTRSVVFYKVNWILLLKLK